ncbi:MAG: S-layer homology domain-containing protein [Bacillota bacterium]|nr:S-layer homology domain-containing protein [Bacillota bacterium]
MKRPGHRFLAVCLTAALLAALLSPAGLAAAEVEIQFDGGGILVYNGAPQEPSVTVTRNGETVPAERYSVTYQDNIDAGTAKAVVTGRDGSQWGEKSFVIQPRALGIGDLSFSLCVKTYDRGIEAQPKVRVSTLGDDMVGIDYQRAVYDNRFAGVGKTVTVSGLSLTGRDKGNYTLPAGLTLTGSGQIIPRTLSVTPTATVQAGGNRLDLGSLVTGGQTVYFTLETDSLGSELINGVLISGNTPGPLTIQATSEDDDVNQDGVPEYQGGTGTIRVTILGTVGGTTDTKDPSEEGEQTALGLLDQPNLVLSGGSSVTYGQSLRFSVTGGGGSGGVTYGVLPLTGNGTIDSGGLFTPTKAGKVRITAQKAGDSQYRPRSADGVEVVIQPAQVTVTVGNKTALVGDPVPALTASDYAVSGLVGGDVLAVKPTLAYAATPDMTRAGIITIRAFGGVVPNSNYQPDIVYQSGLLTVSAQPLYEIRVKTAEHGTLTVDRTTAEPGTRVTVQGTAAEGYRLNGLKVTGEGGQTIRVTETGEGCYQFTMPDCPVTVSADFTAVKPVIPFTDVQEGAWYYDGVAWVYEKGLMTGTSDRSFSPNLTTNRAMIVTVLYRMEGSPEAPAWSPFGDVVPGKYYTAPVAWAAWNGIVNGKTAASFAPEEAITREQLAAILFRFAKFKGYDVSARGDLGQFTDQSSIRAYAREAMAWANGEGLITGTGGGRLDPGGPATRAQVAAILQRFCQGKGL